jgi:hypothetical protein
LPWDSVLTRRAAVRGIPTSAASFTEWIRVPTMQPFISLDIKCGGPFRLELSRGGVVQDCDWPISENPQRDRVLLKCNSAEITNCQIKSFIFSLNEHSIYSNRGSPIKVCSQPFSQDVFDLFITSFPTEVSGGSPNMHLNLKWLSELPSLAFEAIPIFP